VAIRLLMATPEPCPTFRADVATLFGKYLPRLAVFSDVITEPAPGVSGNVSWGGGEGLLMTVQAGRAARHMVRLVHCAHAMFGANRSRYHAIQVRDMPLVALVGLIAARFKNVRFFYWMSFPMPEGQIALARGRGLSSGLVRFLFPWLRGRVGRILLYRIVLPLSDHVFVQSEKMRDEVAARGVSPQKMTPVPMGIDADILRPERILASDDARLTGKRVLIYLGSLDRNRRIDVLFEMLVIVRSRFPNVLLVLAGEADDASHEQWLRQRADALGLRQSVLWTGWLPMHEAWRYVRAAEVGLSPIPRGPLLDVSSPTKAIEYLALGVPVVGNDSPDQKRVIEEGRGGFCVPLEAWHFADATCRLLADPALQREMGESGQRYVRVRRDYARLAADLATRYSTLLGMHADRVLQ